MPSNIHVNKSIKVTASAMNAGEIMADLSTEGIIVLAVFDGYDDRFVTIDRDTFKEFVNTIEEVL